ncbi:hypothetical protein SCLCIDRAFT_979546 [Scleroderma citrinum Foug A]|uniref:Uncharacterized protein n=1 Tax=Scleroderma citrinum Foug A TaxID=1036808 RepID=A0A0C2ZDR4_9AGAM|nr:hypothetical protein SCLCIDRAFT_979546 [Scleroderma citrinum Foug A]
MRRWFFDHHRLCSDVALWQYVVNQCHKIVSCLIFVASACLSLSSCSTYTTSTSSRLQSLYSDVSTKHSNPHRTLPTLISGNTR